MDTNSQYVRILPNLIYIPVLKTSLEKPFTSGLVNIEDLVRQFNGTSNPFEYLTKNIYVGQIRKEDYVGLLTNMHFYLYGYYYFQEMLYSIETPFKKELKNKLEQDDVRPYGKYFKTIYDMCGFLYMENTILAKHIQKRFKSPKYWFYACVLEQLFYDFWESKTTEKFDVVGMWKKRITMLTVDDFENREDQKDLKNTYNPYIHSSYTSETQALANLITLSHILAESPIGQKFNKNYWKPFIKAQEKIVERFEKTKSGGRKTGLVSARVNPRKGTMQIKSRNCKGEETKYGKAKPIFNSLREKEERTRKKEERRRKKEERRRKKEEDRGE